MNFVDGIIYTVNGKEYYFENGRLIISSDGIILFHHIEIKKMIR